MEAKLYVILGSHACRTGILMVEHKGLDYRCVRLPTGFQPFLLRALGYPGNDASFRRIDGRRHRLLGRADRMGTVPTLRVNDRWVSTNRAIARFLDELRPDPPLFPADPDRRAAVEEAERWGDEELQMMARRLALAAVLHGPDALVNRAADGRLGPLLYRSNLVRYLGARAAGRFAFAADAEAERGLLAGLPEALDRVDAWVESGVLNSEKLNAADFMIAPSLALLCYRRDVRPEVERRPAIRLVDRVLPEPALGSAGS